MPLNTGEVLHNRYRIVSRLGQGGFGAVYRAWDLKLNGPCAIKENLDISTAGQKQFGREASLLFNLRHPNLPRVFDTFIVEGQGQYLVMDFIEGEDLQATLDRSGAPLEVEQVLSWTYQVCDALSYLHSQNPPVIHRDIKPANIRITPTGQAVLVDFGIAKVYDPHLKTTLGAQAVTPGYSPPEQYGSGSTDACSDVYSLGATVYTLLTGVVPPASVDIYAGLASPPKPANQANPSVPGGVGAALESAMRPNRTGRLQAVAAFKAALLAGAQAGKVGKPASPPTLIAPQAYSAPPVTPALESTPPRKSAPSGAAREVIRVAARETPAPISDGVGKVEQAHKRVKSRRGVWFVASLVVILLLALTGLGLASWWGYLAPFNPKPLSGSANQPPASTTGGRLRLVHPYEPGSPDEHVLAQALDAARQQFPDLEVEAQYSPTEEIFKTYPELFNQGAAPDLLLAPNDHLWEWARGGILLRLDEYLDGGLEEFFPWSLEGMQGPDGVYGLPSQARVMALYFNRTRIERPPDNTEELMAMVRGGAAFASALQPNQVYGWGAAFGGEIFDDQGHCVANQTGWVEAFNYLHELKMAGAFFDPDPAAIENLFRQGETAMIIDGPWALQDFQERLGDALGVAPMPGGPGGPARPLTGVDGYYVNPHSENVAAAVKLAQFLTGQQAARLYVDQARRIPVRRDVGPTDPLLSAFTEAAGNGFLQAQAPDLARIWGPFQDAYMATIMEGVSPEESLGHACAVINGNP
jgi:serine/threonine protein kinase/maltose-binding protein MalE